MKKDSLEARQQLEPKPNMDFIIQTQPDFQIYSFLAIILMIFTSVLLISDFSRFQLYFGILNPLLAMSIVILLGFVLLKQLLTSQRWRIYSNKTNRGYIIATLIAPRCRVRCCCRCSYLTQPMLLSDGPRAELQ